MLISSHTCNQTRRSIFSGLRASEQVVDAVQKCIAVQQQSRRAEINAWTRVLAASVDNKTKQQHVYLTKKPTISERDATADVEKCRTACTQR